MNTEMTQLVISSAVTLIVAVVGIVSTCVAAGSAAKCEMQKAIVLRFVEMFETAIQGLSEVADVYVSLQTLFAAQYGVKVDILTKGDATLISEDLPLMRRADTHLGITLSFVNDASRAEWEPQASTVQSRLSILHQAYDLGIYTWVQHGTSHHSTGSARSGQSRAPVCGLLEGWQA